MINILGIVGFTDSVATIQPCSCSEKQLWAIHKHMSVTVFAPNMVCFCWWPENSISGITSLSARLSASSLRFLLLLSNQPLVILSLPASPGPGTSGLQ